MTTTQILFYNGLILFFNLLFLWMWKEKVNLNKKTKDLKKEKDVIENKLTVQLLNNLSLVKELKQVLEDNKSLSNQYIKLKKLFESFRNSINEVTDDESSYSVDYYNNDYNKKEKEKTYNIDDILEEINIKGISNVDKDKLNFLNNINK